MSDIYFEEEYGKLYERIEKGVCEVFEFNSANGTIKHMFIKRKIPTYIDEIEYYDICTPYGYGGPLIVEVIKDKEKELVNEFEIAFCQYCEKNNIISEFIRFHPILKNFEGFTSIYQVELIRKTVGTNLSDFEDPIKTEFSKSAKKIINKLLNSGVSYRVIEKPTDYETFKNIYYSTLKRNEASTYYYFDDDYFEKCLSYFQDNIIIIEILFEKKVISAGFYFCFGDIVHAHLSGTLKEFLYLSPAYIIKYATAKWAIDNEKKLIHYGGGTTNSLEDPLYNFKKKFGKNTEFDFYIGKKIWNEQIYNRLCEIKNINENTNFFPLYRFLD